MINGKGSDTKLILTGLLLGLLLSSLDQTITATAMPTVVKELGGLSLYSWVFSIYMLTSTTSMPIYGKLADLYGRKRMYLFGMAIFLVGSALCGMAGSMAQLIVYRGIQGLGAGALMPIAMTIVGDLFPPERRGKFQALFAAVFGVSSILGPVLGGYLTEQVSWNWVFYVNLPFGVAAMCFLAAGLKEKRTTTKHWIDWPGAVTLSGSIIAILLALVLGGESGRETDAMLVGLYGLGGILLGLFLWIETRVAEPILPLTLFRNSVISSASIVSFFMSAGMFGAITYVPFYLQEVLGVKPTIAGYMLIPFMLAFIAGNIIGGQLVTRFRYRQIVWSSLFVMAIGFGLLRMMDEMTTLMTVGSYMIVAGLGMGPLMPVLGTAMQSAVGHQQRGVVTAFFGFIRSMGAAIGVSVMGAMLHAQAVLVVSIQHVFTLGLFFIILAWVAALFLGNARLIKREKSQPQSVQVRR
ncbi:MDR family MFS transporter [Brevibacillus choshinensis]|uniref:MFS transporter n=1 Tax=Brevibacillus choshinensis TaxID=54911 RepID=A0ABX7FIX7_BRECH|nr:MDR family MFS transporter [Brevibacillus choshinensis]QRG66181.1 MFS transporter [Brevibacillus choshinensis]